MVKIEKIKDSNVLKASKKVNKFLKSFLVSLIIGIQIALLISYGYSIYYNNIAAVEGIRDTISYQGKVVNAEGVAPPDAQYKMQFKIYDSLTNGTLKWTEVWDGTTDGGLQTNASQVDIASGVFSVELNSLCRNWVGDCASTGGLTFNDDSFYLQVELDYDGNGTYEEVFTPRKRFTATPYSMNTDKLDGYDSADFVLKAGDSLTGDLSVPTLNVEKIEDSSLNAYYQFNGSADDSTANTLDGTLENSASAGSQVLTIDGVNQYVSVIDDDLLSFGADTSDNPFSVSAWVNIADATSFPIISKGSLNTSGEYLFETTASDTLRFVILDNSVSSTYVGRSYSTALTVNEGDWINVVATYSGTSADANYGITLYLNGVAVDDGNSVSNPVSYVAMENLTSDVYIGRSSAAYANGLIDEVQIISRKLTSDEIRRLYQSELRNIVYSNEISTGQVSVFADDDGIFESANLTWNPVHNRLEFSSELYVPDIIPYFNNSVQDRDYTYLTDSNKILGYSFADSSGTTVTDLEANSNGTFNGDVDWTNLGYMGYGVKFDNEADYVSFVDPGLSATTGSVEIWAKINDETNANTQDNYLIRMYQNSSNEISIYKKYTDSSNPADLYISVGDSGAIDTTWDFPDSNWHHIVLTYNSTAIEVFVDGISVLTSSYTTLTPGNFTGFYLGAMTSTGTNSLDGTMDSVAIYDDVISSQENTNHYNAAFNNLNIINNLSDGNVSASIDDFYSFPYSEAEGNEIDPAYFTNSNKTLALPFSEGSGVTSADVSGSSVNGAITGATWTKKGYYGHGLDFDGTDDNIVLSDHNNFDVGTGDFSIEFWVKGDDSAAQTGKRIISKKDGNYGYEVFFNTEGGNDDRLGFFIGDGSNTITSTFSGFDMSNGQWNHIMYTFDRTNDVAYTYLNGAQSSSIDISTVTGSVDTTTDVYIASDSSSNYFKGTLDSLVLTKEVLNIFDSYNRVLNGGEYLIINHHQLSAGQSPIAGINQGTGGYGGVFYIQNSAHTSGVPLSLWTEASYTSGSDTVYNLINFSTLGGTSSFGNLLWDSTNSQFVFDKSLKTTGDLTSDYIQTVGGNTSNNEFLAFDTIRHTLNSSEASTGNFTEAWSKATTKKVVSINAVTVDESDTDDKLTADDANNAGASDNSVAYDGTNITIYDQNSVWADTDIVTIFIVYEK